MVMLIHHVIGILGLSYEVYTHWCGTVAIIFIFGGELTNPILQCRWFIKKLGLLVCCER